MNTLVTSPKNPCPLIKEYKMLPLEKSKDAYTIKKRPPKAPVVGSVDPIIHYRILVVKDGGIATICADMTKLIGGQLTVRDVNLSSLGIKAAHVGDIVGFRKSDVVLSKPILTHRASQQHQHPEKLVAPEEK
jgi:hypothetical protein